MEAHYMFTVFVMICALMPILTRSSAAVVDLSRESMSIPYNNVHIRVYKCPSPTNQSSYLYTPACTLSPNSTRILFNNHTSQHVVLFSLDLWNADYEAYIQRFVTDKLQQYTPPDVRIIPFRSMRVDINDNTYRHKPMNQWISIADRPAKIFGRLVCTSEQNCNDIVELMDKDKEYFASGLNVSFALKQPERYKRRIPLSKEDLQFSPLFNAFDQRFTQQNNACLRQRDMHRILRETFDHALEIALSDDEFVSEDQMYGIITRAVRLFLPKIVSTDNFTDAMWQNTFWPDIFERPDLKIKSLNEKLHNGNKWMKALFKSGDNFRAMESPRKAIDPQSQEELNAIVAHVHSSEGLIQWDGDTFIIKPMTLHCLDLASLRATESFGNLTVWASIKAGDLSATVNIPVTNLTASAADKQWTLCHCKCTC